MIATLKRCYEIIAVILYYRLDESLPKQGIWRYLSLMKYIHPAHYRRLPEDLSLAVRLRLSLEKLGPIFVKLGQTLSTRPDLIAADISVELSKLQDQVPPFSGEIAQKVIETSLKMPLEAIFAQFDPKALASASVAQVHAAVLHDGSQVVVKVLRPDIEDKVKQDIALMYFLAHLVNMSRQSRRLRLVEIVREFELSMRSELDLLNEAASASHVKANFADSTILHVPQVYWQFCRPQMMVQERIFYVNISDEAAMNAAGVNKKVLAERGVEIFFTQVFRDSFFHADMHPGNIFVDISDPENPKYCAIDFGIMGSLTPEDQHYLAENFLAFFNRDYRRVAQLHLDSGWVAPDTRITDLEAAIRKVSEPIFGKRIKEISFGAFLFNLFQTVRHFDVKIQPQLVLLQKTLFNIEGLGRRLYPDLDLWTTAKPILEKWLAQKISPRTQWKNMHRNALDYTNTLPKLPSLTYRYLEQKINRPAAKSSSNTIAGALLLIAATALALTVTITALWQFLLLFLVGGLGIYFLFCA